MEPEGKYGASAPSQAQPPKAATNGHGLCAQCHGEEGAPPTLHTGAGYPPEGIWLHKECMRFWARDGIPESLRRQ
jgi:hypothetical protein